MFNLGEYMVNAAIQNLKDGTITDTLAITYIGNYFTKGWISEDEMQTALTRIMAMRPGSLIQRRESRKIQLITTL